MIDVTPACLRFAELLSGVRDDQLDAPTPCDEFSVGDLVDHVDHVARGAAALAAGVEDPGPRATHLDPAWRQLVEASLLEFARSWADPAVWAGNPEGGLFGFSNEIWGRISFTEVVVHGWDLAKATEQSFELPQSALEACWDHVETFVPNAPFEGLWGPQVVIGAEAPLLDRILGVTGRRR